MVVLITISATMPTSIVPVWARDPEALQDFCVADANSSGNIRVNGFVCKSAANVTGSDFASTVLRQQGNAAASSLGYVATRATVTNFPGLNTMGLSASRADFLPGGVNSPHVHPRASELIYVLQGTLFVGFIGTDEKLYSATVYPGDLFIFPQGLIHYQINVGTTNATTIVSFSSQNPGTSRAPNALFASLPTIDDVVLSRSFGVNASEIQYLKKAVAAVIV
jgi:oxalate decarboxylase/phosphoglucose isomerase-like protein (cupin superfamily)